MGNPGCVASPVPSRHAPESNAGEGEQLAKNTKPIRAHLEKSTKPIRAHPKQSTERSTSGHGGKNSAESPALLWPDRFIWVHSLVHNFKVFSIEKNSFLIMR